MALEQRKKTKALNLYQESGNPIHTLTFVYWEQLTPSSKKKQADKKMKWYEELVSLNPQSADGQMAAAQIAMEMGLWGEAKAYLKTAERIMPSATLYKLLAQVNKTQQKMKTMSITLSIKPRPLYLIKSGFVLTLVLFMKSGSL